MRKRFALFFTLFILMIAAGVFVFVRPKIGAESNSKLEKVSLRLKWINQAQFAGFFMANKEGYYKEAGIDMRIDPAGPNISPIQMVTSGVNDFGIVGADQILLAREKNIPVVALAVIYRQNPESLVSLKSKNVNSPKDLEGKKVAVIYGNDEVVYRAYLAAHNVDTSKIQEVPANSDITQVLTNQVDAKMAYEMNDSVLLKQKGYDVNVLRFRDDIDFYADTLFTTEDMIKKHPDIVKGVVEASMSGWKKAIADPEKAVTEVLAINSSLNYDHQLAYLRLSIPIIGAIENLGHSDESVWSNMQDLLTKGGVMKSRVDLKDVYTNDFLQ